MSRISFGVLCLIVLCTSAFAEPVKLADGIPVHVILLKTLVSGEGKTGDEVPFTLRDDIYGPNHELLAQKGTPVIGKIVMSKRHTLFGKAGKLDLSCDYATAVDGTKILLRGEQPRKGKEKKAAAILPLNGAIGVGFIRVGKDIKLKEGTEFTVYVDQDTMIDPAKAEPVVKMKYLTVSQKAYRTVAEGVTSALHPSADSLVKIAVVKFQLIPMNDSTPLDKSAVLDARGGFARVLSPIRGLRLVNSEEWDKAITDLKLDNKPLNDKDIANIAAQVGAKYILTGNITDKGNAIVINTRLLDAATGDCVRKEMIEEVE